MSLCSVTDSIYLVGFFGDGLFLWNKQTDQLLSKICGGGVFSIKRVMNTNYFVIKTWHKGVELITINDFDSFKFSARLLFDA